MMQNFNFKNPTELLFGKGSISKLTQKLVSKNKILLVFGGGSVKANGVYEQVLSALSTHEIVEFWGVDPNPKVETLREVIVLGKQEGVDFIVAIGGGSVLDAVKLISCGICSEDDAWNIVMKAVYVGEYIPFASVMTLPATGSEMNNGAVISNASTQEKFPFFSNFPVFSILDPETTYSLPKFQLACGLTDTFVHVMEQYLTASSQSLLMDRWAEGILQTVIEIAPKIMKDQTNYALMSEFMLSATMALNGFIAMGVEQDWTSHMIGHELTALYGITHGQTLAVVFPASMRVMRVQKRNKLLQYAERVWKLNPVNEEACIDEVIGLTEYFFKSLGLSTRLIELNIPSSSVISIEEVFKKQAAGNPSKQLVSSDLARDIILSCYK